MFNMPCLRATLKCVLRIGNIRELKGLYPHLGVSFEGNLCGAASAPDLLLLDHTYKAGIMLSCRLSRGNPIDSKEVVVRV